MPVIFMYGTTSNVITDLQIKTIHSTILPGLNIIIFLFVQETHKLFVKYIQFEHLDTELQTSK